MSNQHALGELSARNARRLERKKTEKQWARIVASARHNRQREPVTWRDEPLAVAAPSQFYNGFDDLPKEAREFLANSVWLGVTLSHMDYVRLPRGSDLMERLRKADAALLCGSNLEDDDWSSSRRLAMRLALGIW